METKSSKLGGDNTSTKTNLSTYGYIRKELNENGGVANEELITKANPNTVLQDLESKLKKPDFNLDRALMEVQTNPKFYSDLLVGLRIRQNETLLHYSNSKHYKKGPSYQKYFRV